MDAGHPESDGEAVNSATFTFLGREIPLIYAENYGSVPLGTVLASICGEVKIKGHDYIDMDTRGGWLAYGIIPLDLLSTLVVASSPSNLGGGDRRTRLKRPLPPHRTDGWRSNSPGRRTGDVAYWTLPSDRRIATGPRRMVKENHAPKTPNLEGIGRKYVL